MNHEATLNYLSMHGVKPSIQRMAVMGYLMEHHTHPTADEIYNAMVQTIPTLSKTTVYNTLKLLVEQGAVVQLSIDGKNACFDAETQPHAHFLCKNCGRVFDIPLRNPQLSRNADLPAHFRLDEASLYFKGCCDDCLHKAAEAEQ